MHGGFSVTHFNASPAMTSELADLISNSQIAGFDYDGVVLDTEAHQMMAFTNLLNSKTGAQHDYRAIAKQMLGKAEHVIISEFQKLFGLQGHIDTLVEERGVIYQESLCKSNLQPNGTVQAVLDFAKALHIPRIIISNGRNRLINHFNNHWGIAHKFDNVFAIDSRPTADKTEFLLGYARDMEVCPSRAVIFEDSVSTLERMAERSIQGVYVRHQFNRPDFVPNTGIVIDMPKGAVAPA